MTVEHAVRVYLLAAVGVSAIVATRIYQLRLPQTPTLPALRLQLIDEPQNYHLRGPDGATRARVQIDAYGSEAAGSDPYASVTTLGTAVDLALSGQEFTVGALRVTGAMRASRRMGYESETLRVVRCSQDYTMWFKEF